MIGISYLLLNMPKGKSRKKQPKTQAPKSADEPMHESGNANPYGGIPPRELKKNLGCG
jgi:hypothetical protein